MIKVPYFEDKTGITYKYESSECNLQLDDSVENIIKLKNITDFTCDAKNLDITIYNSKDKLCMKTNLVGGFSPEYFLDIQDENDKEYSFEIEIPGEKPELSDMIEILLIKYQGL